MKLLLSLALFAALAGTAKAQTCPAGYTWSGTACVVSTGGGGGGSGGSGIGQPWCNLSPALADATGATDATAAMQACINTLAPGGTNDGMFIVFPPAASPNFFYLCTGQLTWGSVVHGSIILQPGFAANGCAMPADTAATWVQDQTTGNLKVAGQLSAPNTTTWLGQSFQVGTPSTGYYPLLPTVPCAGTPGNTVGAYRQDCQTAGGALYACNNAAGCTTSGDWVAGSVPNVVTSAGGATLTNTLCVTGAGSKTVTPITGCSIDPSTGIVSAGGIFTGAVKPTNTPGTGGADVGIIGTCPSLVAGTSFFCTAADNTMHQSLNGGAELITPAISGAIVNTDLACFSGTLNLLVDCGAKVPSITPVAGKVMTGISTAGAPSLAYQGGQTCLTATSDNSGLTTEFQIVGATIAANTIQVGTTFHIKAFGLQTNSGTTGNQTYRVKMNHATLGANIMTSVQVSTNGTNASTNAPIVVDAYATVWTTGSSGTAIGGIGLLSVSGVAAADAFTTATIGSTAVNTTTLDTTVSQIVELTVLNSTANYTSSKFTVACVEVIKP